MREPRRPVFLRLLATLLSGALAVSCAGRAGPFAERRGGGPGAVREGSLPESDAELPIAPPLTGEPILLPGREAGGGSAEVSDRKARRKVDEADASWKERFDAAREAAAAGADEAALTLIQAALSSNPKSPWDQRFKALKADVKARHIEVNVLRIDVRPTRDYVGFDEDVDLLIRIRNVGGADVVIRPPDGFGPDAVSGSTLVLTMRRTDRDIYEAELSHSWTQSVPLLAAGAAELVIPPEGVHEIRVRIPAEEVGGAIAGLKVLDLSGELRAGRILAGIEEPFGRVPIRPGRVVVLPANYEPIAADALGSLARAVDALAPIHLLVATEFLASDDRPAAASIFARALSTASEELRPAVLNALDLLRRSAVGTPVRPLAEPFVAALAAHPERASDVMEGLHAVTLVSLPPDARLWNDWWRKEISGPGASIEADDTSRARVIDAGRPRFSEPEVPATARPAPTK